MSGGRKIEIETPGDAAEEKEGWESLAEEESGPTLSPSAELEAALREAAAAVEEPSRPAAEAPAGAPDDPPAAPAAEGGGDLASELKQVQDRLLRLQADFENFRRRALKEKTEAHQYGHQNLVKDLLSVVDNLDRAIDHAKEGGSGEEKVLEGVELVRREFMTALGKHGVFPVEALGQPFDPAVHEAMAQAPDGTVAPNTVVQELQKGYKVRDRLIRPARVIVARAPDEAESPAEPGTGKEEGAAD